MEKTWTLNVVVDGGCKGNGSESAVAYGSYAVMSAGGTVLFAQTDQYPELSTNNQAEVNAVLVALQAIKSRIEEAGKADPHNVDIRIKTDSQLVVGFFHATKPYQRKDPTLRMLAAKVDLHKTAFRSVWINKTSRNEVNRVLGH